MIIFSILFKPGFGSEGSLDVQVPIIFLSSLSPSLNIYFSKKAEVFALLVLLCDGYLKFKVPQEDLKAIRVFQMITKLPLELQMTFCQRLFLSPSFLIPTSQVETAILEILERFEKH